MMSKSIHLVYAIVCLLLLGLQTACVSDDHEDGRGKLQIQVGVNEDVIVETKAGTTSQLDSCKVLIKNDKGDIIRKYENATTMPTEEWLIAGRYVVEASLGTPKKAEFDHPCYIGEAVVDVVANKSVSKEVVCKLSQSKVSVVYEKGITANFKDYATDIVMGTSKLTFKKDAVKIGYYYNGTEEKQNLVCTITATPNSGSAVKKEFTIENIKSCTHYVIHADYNTEVAEGGFKFEIEVNELTDDKNDDVTVPITKYPVIECGKMWILGQIIGARSSLSINVKGYPELSSIILSGDLLATHNLPTSVDLLNLEAPAKLELENKGFVIGDVNTDAKDVLKHQLREIKVPILLSELSSKTLNVKVIDSKGQTRELKGIEIIVTDLHVVTIQVEEADVWATHATLRGQLNGTPTSTVGFQYRKTGESSWTKAEGSVNGEDDERSIVIKGLTPGTEYEYCITEGEKTAETKYFTTEVSKQLPNGSFDEWNGNNPWLAGGTKFWDTGNGAASTAGLVLTTSSDELPNGIMKGKSAYLKSQYKWFFVDIFAAGNLFVGDFGKIEGTSGASMYFGQPYTSRPSSLTGYYKYKSAIINWDKKGLKGKNDRFHIYVMLVKSRKYLNTTDQTTFFNYEKIKKGEDPNILGFGEITSELVNNGIDNTPAVSMNEFKKFSIPLTYYNLKEKPQYIIVAATSSKYGDFFTGGEGSELWVDEFNLVFDDNINVLNN